MTEEYNVHSVIGSAPAVLTNCTIYVSCAKYVVFTHDKVSDSWSCFYMNGNFSCFSF